MKPISDEMVRALRNLPPRQPRGSPGNLIRAFMLPFLLKGMSKEEARQAAVEKAKEMLGEIIKEAK